MLSVCHVCFLYQQKEKQRHATEKQIIRWRKVRWDIKKINHLYVLNGN
ncbi:hypothetical protein HanIR_Chr10g0487981 [Helianthus annuus]|nr:hypothetical protein HanIR_Chr10g0487981 [Helianthus annuus]